MSLSNARKHLALALLVTAAGLTACSSNEATYRSQPASTPGSHSCGGSPAPAARSCGGSQPTYTPTYTQPAPTQPRPAQVSCGKGKCG
jgi:hypothetical protein